MINSLENQKAVLANKEVQKDFKSRVHTNQNFILKKLLSLSEKEIIGEK